MKVLIFFAILGYLLPSWGGLFQGFDSLGGNDVLLKKLEDHPREVEVRVVQNRVTDRTSRLEVYTEYSHISRGSSYVNSHSVGGAVNYHVTPHWSLGFKYSYFNNQLTREGEDIIERAQRLEEANPSESVALIPELNWPRSSVTSTLSFYPLYGKVNVFDLGVVHFDLYGTVGGGWMQLRNGSSPTYLGGGGVGMWFSQYISSRVEYTYQEYRPQYASGRAREGINTISFSLGFLL